jgi:hypothetical protein
MCLVTLCRPLHSTCREAKLDHCRRRQYIHQLDKWGIRKYARRDVKAVRVSRDLPTQFGQMNRSVTGSFVETRTVAKRHGSFQSTTSRDSESRSPTLQERKKLKHNIEDLTLPTSLDFVRPVECPTTILGPPIVPASGHSHSTSSAKEKPYDNTKVLEDQADSGMDTPTFEEFTTHCVAEATTVVTARSIHLYPALEITIKAKGYREKSACTFLAHHGRQQIVDAADYLLSCLAKEEAFDIYAALIGTEEATSPPTQGLALLTACARSSQLQFQCQFIQEAFLKYLQGSAGKIMSPLDRFLAHMLMAECYTVHSNASDAGKHLEEAKISVRNFRTLTASQLNDTPKRLVYLYHKRYLMMNIEANQREAGASLDCFDGAKIVSQQDFAKFVTTVFHCHTPDLSLVENAPWTSSPGPPSLPYTRYCLLLCQKALEDFDNPQFSGFSWTLTTHSGWKYIRWAETLALFTHVWTEWQRSYRAIPVNKSWAQQVQEHVGISCIEVLSIFCEMINLATPWEISTTDSSLLRRFREGLAFLRDVPDEDLETKFLQLWYARTFRARGAQQYAAFLGPLPEFILSPLQRIRSITATMIEVEQQKKHRSHPHVASCVKTDYLDPTLAPSCRSSDSSYRRFRDTASSVWYRLGNTVPSGDDSLSRTSSRSRNARSSVRLSQISQLSELMRIQIESMSISEHPEDAFPYRSSFI